MDKLLKDSKGGSLAPVAKDIWNKVLDSAKNELKPQTFDTWFKPIEPIELKSNRLGVRVPNQFFKNWIQEHYQNYLETILQTVLSENIELEISVDQQKMSIPVKRIPTRKSIPINKTNFQGKYSFDEFIVGPSNRLAYAASIAVAEKPALTYNPLFIYGASGLGKTHLLQSVGLSVSKHYPQMKVVYISCEEFTNQLINAIQTRNTVKFRNRYRTVDILLIDDIHFLSGKEQTQEEFFHTFNALYDSRKQIILSSDKPPKEIKNLEDRLVSRFEWGLVSDIQYPDYETRCAILNQKAQQMNVNIDPPIIRFLAENIRTNIRKLEGALIKITSYSSLTGRPITMEVAQELLHEFVAGEKIISIESIQKKVAEHYDIRFADMTSKKRPKAIAFPRQIAMFLTKELTTLSLTEIGEGFGGRDHTTVMHAINVVDKNLKNDFTLQNTLKTIKQKIII